MRQRNQNQKLVSAVAMLFIGLIGVWGMGDAALERYRSVDVLRLLGAGACFGVALVAIISFFRGARADGA